MGAKLIRKTRQHLDYGSLVVRIAGNFDFAILIRCCVRAGAWPIPMLWEYRESQKY